MKFFLKTKKKIWRFNFVTYFCCRNDNHKSKYRFLLL